jgi:hypothetical protein
MTEFQTNYDPEVIVKLTKFKGIVETNWFNYFDKYKSGEFNNADEFKDYLKKPDPNDYKEKFVRLKTDKQSGKQILDESEVNNAWLPVGNNDEREYYIPKPVLKGVKNSKDEKNFDVLNNFYSGIKKIDKDGKEFQVPQLVQKLKYLVIKKREELFEQAIQRHVIIFSGGTGTGKSTQLPQYFLEFGFNNFKYQVKELEKDTSGNYILDSRGKKKVIDAIDKTGNLIKRPMMIACTQPRKLAVDTIQKSVSQMLGDWDYNNDKRHFNLVGKKYKGTDEQGKAIQFISEGSLLTIYNSKIKDYPYYAFDEYSVIMIDEAHMRSIDIDRLLAIIKNKVIPIRTAMTNSPFLLVVMSATANLPTFEKYFGGTKAIVVEGTQKPVDIRFQKEPVTDYVGKSVELAKEIHTNPDSHISYLCETTDDKTVKKDGFILAFLNTGGEISNAVEAINNNPVVDSNGGYLYAYGLASESLKSDAELITNLDNKDSLLKVLKDDAEKKYNDDKKYPWDKSKSDNITRAVIFATNVAEASVTIDNLSYCIDSGLEYKMIYNPTNDLTIAAIIPTSKANVLQRKGRVGRKQVGNYYPLFTNEINPVKQPIDQYKELNCAIPGKSRQTNFVEIISKFDNIFTTLNKLETKQYEMENLIDNLIKYLPLYEYNIYHKLNKVKLINYDINSLSLIGKKDDTLDAIIDTINVKCRLDKNIFISKLENTVTNLSDYPTDIKNKQTFIIGLFTNSTEKFINNKNVFAGDYPWNQNNLEFCIDILEKIIELVELNSGISFNDVKDISKEDIKRVKNIGRLKGKMTITEIKKILTKRIPKINEDTEPEILSSELSDFLLEILNLQPFNKSGNFEFNVLSKIINNEGLLINPRTENLQNAIKKIIKSGIIEVADPFGNELRIKYDPDLSIVINLPTKFENKMMLYKTLKNNNLNSVFISSIYLSCIIDYLQQQKGQSERFITRLLKIGEKTELIDDIIAEDDIYVPGNIIFTTLLFMFKYLPRLKQAITDFFNYLGIKPFQEFSYSEEDVKKINGIIKSGKYDLQKIGTKYNIEYSTDEDFKKKNIFYLAISNDFNTSEDIRENKIRVFFDIMRFVVETIKTLFDETKGLEFIDDIYLTNPILKSRTPLPTQIYPNDKAEMQEYIQRLQYSVLEGYHPELCIREGEKYLHSRTGLTFSYNESERILPKYLVQLESSLKYKGYLISLACSIEPSIYDIFKKHLDKVNYTISPSSSSTPPALTIPSVIKGGSKPKKSNDSFDPIIYF